MGCASEKSAERRITSFPMKDLGGSGKTSAYSDRNSDAPVILNIYFTFNIISKNVTLTSDSNYNISINILKI